jgi:hypothetical protein
MKQFHEKLRITALLALSVLATPLASHAQARYAKPSDKPTKNKEVYFVPQKPPISREMKATIRTQVTAGQTIPMWNYSTVAQDGKTYTGSMVGRSPFAHGHRSTVIPTYLVPVIITMQDSGDVFDPTTFDGCGPANESVIQVIQNSPSSAPRTSL